jgi:hypothetical protein
MLHLICLKIYPLRGALARLPLLSTVASSSMPREDRSMGNSKIAIVAYCLAVGFILAVALHSPSKTLATADIVAARPVALIK